MKKNLLVLISVLLAFISVAQKDSTIRKKDRKRDVLLQTNYGDIIVRLYDSTPFHRDNFLKLVKTGYYDSVLFHRVIQNFMIQGGDPNSKQAKPGEPLGNGGPGYTIPAEFRQTIFHKKGVIAAARMGDNVNPEKASSGSQFYICLKAMPNLDGQYTVFGHIASGMELLDALSAKPTDTNDNPVEKVRIKSIRIVEREKAGI